MRGVPRSLVWGWVALVVLLSLTLALAYVPLGSKNMLVALLIAAAKALIVVFVFMKVARGPSLTWLFAGAGLLWLLFLFGLSAVDYLTRSGFPPQP